MFCTDSLPNYFRVGLVIFIFFGLVKRGVEKEGGIHYEPCYLIVEQFLCLEYKAKHLRH